MKRCTVCNTEKQYEAFHKDSSRNDGYRNMCKNCVSAHSKQYYQKNKDKIIAKYYVWLNDNRERHNQRCGEWVRKNRDKVNERTARRYASKTQATPKWLSKDERWMIIEAYHLAKLRERTIGGKWEVDHIIPLRGRTVMGLHVPWNLRVVPMQQNRRKSNTVSPT
jgi:hypothetical protein